MNEYGDSFLLAPFREFYREVIRLKRVIRAGTIPHPLAPGADADDSKLVTGTWVFFPEIISEVGLDERTGMLGGTTSGTTPAPGNRAVFALPEHHSGDTPALEYSGQPPADHLRIYTLVWHRLLTLFERQAQNAWRYGGSYGAEFYKEAQYVMVALADEIFLHEMKWEGQGTWISNLLETKFFQSHVAGELFFQKLDRILRDRDPVYKDLAAVYLMALSLGFKGKYRGVPDGGRIAHYRQQLFAFIFRRDARLELESKHIFPEAYLHTRREEKKKRLRHPRVWIGVLSLVLVTYLVATHLLWVDLTARLNQVNDRIAVIVNDLSKKR
jgi:type VI secretion system protein ImpK